jgi:DNA-binding response OmpR family regulator
MNSTVLPFLSMAHAPQPLRSPWQVAAEGGESFGSGGTTSAGDPTPGPAGGDLLRVLVVDDNVDAAESMAMLLEADGHEVFVAHDGASAWSRILAETPGVCLLDIGLPDVDGHALARRIRTLPAMASAVLIALTGYGQEEDRKRSMEAGFDLHLVKPVDPGQLVAALLALPRSGGAVR